MFGTSSEDIPSDCLRLIRGWDFGYRRLSGDERDAAILSVLKRILSEDLTVAGDAGSRSRWERGWTENLRSLAERGYEQSALVPKYIRENQPLRLYQDYIMPRDAKFELNWYKVFTLWLFRKYFQQVDVVYEFGCGSGINIATLAKIFPDKKIVGLDWAVASKKIITKLAKANGWNVEGRVFDFFKPDPSLELAENSGLLTVGGLEQTGMRYGPFLAYVLKALPTICVNIEPICEWYDRNRVVDYVAIMFHKRRGYWEGFPARLKSLGEGGKVEILKTKRSYFGSLFIEGYSQTIWKPVGGKI